jgi:hypothetical protein
MPLVCIGISRIDGRKCVLGRGSIEIWVRGLSVAGDTSTAALAIARVIGRVDGSTGTFDLTKVASSSMTRHIARSTEMLRSRAESVVAGIEPDIGGRASLSKHAIASQVLNRPNITSSLNCPLVGAGPSRIPFEPPAGSVTQHVLD